MVHNDDFSYTNKKSMYGNIHLHLVDFYGTCRQIYTSPMDPIGYTNNQWPGLSSLVQTIVFHPSYHDEDGIWRPQTYSANVIGSLANP